MLPSRLVRIVALRKGKLKPSEFMLRPGEKGLSLFALVDDPSPEVVLKRFAKRGNKAT